MQSEWKIYTKTGDDGTTSLIGGTRVPKYDDRIEAYGTADELLAWVGLIRDQDIDTETKKVLLEIQDRLFTLQALLANDATANKRVLPQLSETDIVFLEKEMDQMNEKLPDLTSFILPGGDPSISYCHLARTVCRRSERLCIKLNDAMPINPLIIKYLNRLSDYLFVLSRKFSSDLGIDEKAWKPRV